MLPELGLALVVVFAVNLLPAFGPPSWAVLVALTASLGVPAALLVPAGALAAASGRFVLATGARTLRGRLDPRRVESLDVARAELERRRGATVAGLGLFALSPVPSAQLFVAAGLTGVRLVPLTLAFFSGRLVSYAVYVGAATAAHDRLRDVVGEGVASPWAIALQVAMLGGLVALARVDWGRVLSRRSERRRPPAATLPRAS